MSKTKFNLNVSLLSNTWRDCGQPQAVEATSWRELPHPEDLLQDLPVSSAEDISRERHCFGGTL